MSILKVAGAERWEVPLELVANSIQQQQCQIGNAGHHPNLVNAILVPATLATLVYPVLPQEDGNNGMHGMDHQAGVFRCSLWKRDEVETRSCSKTIGNVEESPLSQLDIKQRCRWVVEKTATANDSKASTVVMGAAPEVVEEAPVHGEICGSLTLGRGCSVVVRELDIWSSSAFQKRIFTLSQ